MSCHAYLQGDGSWGWSNAGLIIGDGASLLVDNLVRSAPYPRDARRDGADDRGRRRFGQVVNTHANGDHCYGNILVDDAEIIATRATAEEMSEVPPSLLAGLNSAPGRRGRHVPRLLRCVRLRRHRVALPDRTFDGRLDLDVGGRTVELIEVGPAHTKGDTLALRARCAARSTPATSCSSAAPRSCGPAAEQLGRGVRL
jgi:glyoxylase-like metal-dependent hydrolase (beta-lactamase superfamily II)